MKFQEQKIELKSTLSLQHVRKGMAYADKKEYDEAIVHFTKAISFEPDVADFYRRRGLAYREVERNEEAIVDLNRAVELEPDNPMHFLNRAGAYLSVGRFEEGVVDFTWNISMAHENSESAEVLSDMYLFRAEAYLIWDKPLKAIEDANIALTFTPMSTEVIEARVNINKALKRTKDVIDDLLLLLKLEPDNISLYFNLAIEFYIGGEFDHAKKYIDLFFEFAPNIDRAHVARAFINDGFVCKEAVRQNLLKAIELGDDFAAELHNAVDENKN